MDRAQQDDVQYVPLDPQKDEIRVLILEPGSDQDAIRCTLETHQLKTCREYEALSYAWGDPTPVGPIFVDGSPTLVARNLSVALRYLRYAHSSRVLWIDAICINQMDTQERNHQVFMMGKIYKTARLVVVWLGEPQCSSDIIMDRFKALEGQRKVAEIEQIPIRIILYEWLLNVDWWSRLWVVQEIVLAKSDPIIMCGSRCVSWDTFRKGCNASSFGYVLEPSEKAIFKTWTQFGALYLLRRHYQELCLEVSLNDALMATKDFRASDPRDAIYGCLGLLRASERETLKPDYHRSTELLFLETTQRLLKQSDTDFYSRFSISRRAGALSENSPSWVPDFSEQDITIPSDPMTIASKSGTPPFWSVERCVSFADNDAVLVVSGFLFDRVEVAIELGSDPALILAQIPELDYLMQQGLDKEIPPDDSRYHLSRLKRQEDLFSVIGNALEDSANLRSQYEALVSQAEVCGEKRMIPKTSGSLLVLVNFFLPERCFFVTSMGFVGIAVTKVCKSDCVTFLFGESTPIILRPQGSSYTMVGAANISSVMMSGVTGPLDRRRSLMEETIFHIR